MGCSESVACRGAGWAGAGPAWPDPATLNETWGLSITRSLVPYQKSVAHVFSLP